MNLAILALAAAATLATPDAPPESRIEVVEAGRIEYDLARHRVIVTGGVVLKRGDVWLRAPTASYDEETGEVDASGGVLLTEPGRAVAANSLHAVIDGPYEAHDVVAFLKDAPLDLSRCRTLDEARAKGRNRTTVRGNLVEGVAAVSRFDVEHARITMCDCGAGPPSWEMRAHSASVEPGHHAWLTLPVFYITPRFLFWHHRLFGGPKDPKPIPVLALPVAYLPLADRQTGLLMPVLSELGDNGWAVDEPLFITLGRSWDATLTAGWVLGPSDPHRLHGIKGPGGSAELRWAPAEGMNGMARFTLHHSLISDWPQGAARPPGANRIALELMHDQRISDRSYFKSEVGLVDDPFYMVDFYGNPLIQNERYRRSAVAFTHRRDDSVLEADAAYLEPLQFLDAACAGQASCVAAPFGPFGTSVRTFNRLPSASLTLLPLRVAGPLHVSAFASVARFAPIHGAMGDEGADGIGPGEQGWSGGAIDLDDTEGNGRWERGERLAATRALTRIELRAPLSLRRFVTVEPWLAGTGAAYAFEAAASAQADARLAGGVTLSSSLSRTFGGGETRLRHVFEPSVAWRAGAAEAGPGLPAYAYDEMDASPLLFGPRDGSVIMQRTLSATPGGAFSQVRLAIRNRLALTSGPRSLASLDLTLGQDADLTAGGRLAETWAQTALSVALPRGATFGTGGTARFYAFGAHRPAGFKQNAAPSSLDAFSELSGNARIGDARGDDIHASLSAVGPGGSPVLLGGLEPFFDFRALPVEPSATGSVGVTAKIAGGTFVYEGLFYPRTTSPPSTCRDHSSSPRFYGQHASVVWDSPCHCWKMGIDVSLNECDASPHFKFVFGLSSLAEHNMGF